MGDFLYITLNSRQEAVYKPTETAHKNIHKSYSMCLKLPLVNINSLSVVIYVRSVVLIAKNCTRLL